MLDSPKKIPEKKPWNISYDMNLVLGNSSDEEEKDYGILPDIGKKNFYLNTQISRNIGDEVPLSV